MKKLLCNGNGIHRDKERKRRGSSRILFCLVFMFILLISLIACGYADKIVETSSVTEETNVIPEDADNSINSETESDEDALKHELITDAVQFGETALHTYLANEFKFENSEVFHEQIFCIDGLSQSIIDQVLTNNPVLDEVYFKYYINEISYEYEFLSHEDKDYMILKSTWDLFEDSIPHDEIYKVTSKKDLYDSYEKIFQTGFERTVIYIYQSDADEIIVPADAVNLMEEVEWNNAEKMPYAYRQGRYEVVDSSQTSDYILISEMDYDFYDVTQQEQIEAQQEVVAQVDALYNRVREQASDPEEQCKVLYNLLRKEISYNYAIGDALLNYKIDNNREICKKRGIYGALIDHSTVCSGFAAAYKAVCDRLGIPCIVLLGYADNGDHAWNMIILDNQIYHIDVTWGLSDKWASTYFMISDDTYTHENRRTYNYIYVPEEFYEAGYIEKSAPTELYD